MNSLTIASNSINTPARPLILSEYLWCSSLTLVVFRFMSGGKRWTQVLLIQFTEVTKEHSKSNYWQTSQGCLKTTGKTSPISSSANQISSENFEKVVETEQCRSIGCYIIFTAQASSTRGWVLSWQTVKHDTEWQRSVLLTSFIQVTFTMTCFSLAAM